MRFAGCQGKNRHSDDKQGEELFHELVIYATKIHVLFIPPLSCIKHN